MSMVVVVVVVFVTAARGLDVQHVSVQQQAFAEQEYNGGERVREPYEYENVLEHQTHGRISAYQQNGIKIKFIVDDAIARVCV